VCGLVLLGVGVFVWVGGGGGFGGDTECHPTQPAARFWIIVIGCGRGVLGWVEGKAVEWGWCGVVGYVL